MTNQSKKTSIYGVRGILNPIIQPIKGNVTLEKTTSRIIGISRCDLKEVIVECIVTYPPPTYYKLLSLFTLILIYAHSSKAVSSYA